MEELVAIRYATSLFEVGTEENCLDALLEETEALRDLFSQSDELLRVLGTPVVTSEEKTSLIDNALGNKVSKYMLNFLKILTEKHRIMQFEGIAKQFRLLYNQKNNIQDVVAVTAVPLSDKLSEKLKTKLEQITGKTIILDNKVNAEIMGGIILNMQGDQIDASVKGRIDELRQHISAIIA